MQVRPGHHDQLWRLHHDQLGARPQPQHCPAPRSLLSGVRGRAHPTACPGSLPALGARSSAGVWHCPALRPLLPGSDSEALGGSAALHSSEATSAGGLWGGMPRRLPWEQTQRSAQGRVLKASLQHGQDQGPQRICPGGCASSRSTAGIKALGGEQA